MESVPIPRQPRRARPRHVPREIFVRAVAFSGVATLVAYLALAPAGPGSHWTNVLPAAGSIELLVALMARSEGQMPITQRDAA